MSVSIRMVRYGKKNAPMYRIIAVDKRRAYRAECLDTLGTYNPVTGKFVNFHAARVAEWVKKGAQMSDTVAKLYRKHQKGAGSSVVAPIVVAPKEPTTSEAVKSEA